MPNQFNKHMKKLLLVLITLFTLQGYGQCWKEVASGYTGMGGIKNDGTLWTWGYGSFGILGYDEDIDQATPKQVGADTDWEKIEFGFFFMLAQKANGEIWMTGRLKEDFNYEYTPMLQLGSGSAWKTFSCGKDFAMLIKSDGTLWAIGNNDVGQLGYGPINDMSEMYFDTLIQIGSDTDWKAVAAGDKHCIAIKEDGSLWNWGQLHWYDDWEENIFSPVQIGLDTNWEKIDAGLYINAAIKTDGTLWTWGDNYYGQLGLVDNIERLVPTQQGTSTWSFIDISLDSMHGVRTNGKLYAWGNYYNGQLGNGMYATSPDFYIFYSPTLIFGDSGWKTSGSKYEYFTAFLHEDGTLKTCGAYHPALGTNYGAGSAFYTTELGLVAPIPQSVTCSTASLNDNTLFQISLYPNPTSATITLENAENLNIESLTVTDMTSKVVLLQNGNAAQINVEKLPAGMYFLTVSAKEGFQNMKFIKE